MGGTAKTTKDLLLQKHNQKNEKPDIMNLCRAFLHSKKERSNDKTHENRRRKFTLAAC